MKSTLQLQPPGLLATCRLRYRCDWLQKPASGRARLGANRLLGLFLSILSLRNCLLLHPRTHTDEMLIDCESATYWVSHPARVELTDRPL